MKVKIVILTLFLSLLTVITTAGNAFSFANYAINDTVSIVEKELPQVEIVAFNGQLSIKSSDIIIVRAEVYSAIGGLLYQSEVNKNDLIINDFPKTILVIRIKFKNGKLGVYKIKMQ
jgi:predicted GTPase